MTRTTDRSSLNFSHFFFFSFCFVNFYFMFLFLFWNNFMAFVLVLFEHGLKCSIFCFNISSFNYFC